VLNQIHRLFCAQGEDGSDMERERSPALHPVSFLEKSWLSEEFSGGCFACLFRPHCFCASGPVLKIPLRYGHDSGAAAGGADCWSHADPVTETEMEGGAEAEGEIAVEWCSTETAPMFCGYMEGALLAGEETAKRILSSLNLSVSSGQGAGRP
jgi:hypothetical protein